MGPLGSISTRPISTRSRILSAGRVVDLVVRGEADAKANDRDLVQPWDLPIFFSD